MLITGLVGLLEDPICHFSFKFDGRQYLTFPSVMLIQFHQSMALHRVSDNRILIHGLQPVLNVLYVFRSESSGLESR